MNLKNISLKFFDFYIFIGHISKLTRFQEIKPGYKVKNLIPPSAKEKCKHFLAVSE